MDSRILIVDDETSLLKMVTILLKKEGFTNLDTASNGIEALNYINNHEYDLVLLDVNLPDIEGYKVCMEIRSKSNVPIFFLTARCSDLDKITGFAFGADDYITKPFNPLELVARVKAHLKRKNIVFKENEEKITFNNGSFSIYLNEGVVKVNDMEINLTAQLFQLLCFFAKSPNRIFSKEQIYRQVWGNDSFGTENTVTVHVRKLREKIEEDPSNPKYLVTVRGLGYKFISEPKT